MRYLLSLFQIQLAVSSCVSSCFVGLPENVDFHKLLAMVGVPFPYHHFHLVFAWCGTNPFIPATACPTTSNVLTHHAINMGERRSIFWPRRVASASNASSLPSVVVGVDDLQCRLAGERGQTRDGGSGETGTLAVGIAPQWVRLHTGCSFGV